MSPRPRKTGKKDLPLNLYEYNGYYKYRHPETSKFISLGRDKSSAIAAANQANAELIKSEDLAARIMGFGKPFNDFLDRFENELLPERAKERGLSKSTVKDYMKKIPHIRNVFGDKPGDEITVRDLSDFLDTFPNVQSNRYRSLLALIFQYAIVKGVRDDNPAQETMKKQERPKRMRLTLEGYRAIYAYASVPIKNAMDLALQTLQRREDISNMKWSDIKNGYIEVIQEKTKAPIKIQITPPLQEVLNLCRDNVLSTYIIHQSIEANKARRSKKLSSESLTKGFCRFRIKSGFYKDIPTNQEPPSFHEIRSLGAELYRKSGWPEKEIQKLLGHKTIRMTEKYLDRHEIKWIEVQGGLKV